MYQYFKVTENKDKRGSEEREKERERGNGAFGSVCESVCVCI